MTPNVEDYVNITNTSSLDKLYSCGNGKLQPVSNALGLLVLVVIFSYIVFRLIQQPNILSITKMLSFTADQNILKMFVSLMLFSNIRTLSNSLINNVILPVIRPLLPILICNLKVKIGLFEINVGEFISDLLVFLINVYLVFVVYALMPSQA